MGARVLINGTWYYLLDILDPLPREWMIPNFLIGGAILALGFAVVSWLNRDETSTARK
jgi:hypothetical protein